MACLFEVLLPGEATGVAADAAEAAFQELDRLERLLSRFCAYSDVSRLNAAPAGQWVVVEIETFECLAAARAVWAETNRAFDVTAGVPDRAGEPAAGAADSRRPDMSLLELDEQSISVRRLDASVRVDLGGIGKGYALDRMAELLRDWDIETALLHGGSSTAVGIGCPPGRDGWRLALRDPLNEQATPLGWVLLRDQAFSGSSTAHTRHITNPRTGQAAAENRAAWAAAPTAAEADAVTTALCVMDFDEIERYSQRRPDRPCLAARREAGEWRLTAFGPNILVRG